MSRSQKIPTDRHIRNRSKDCTGLLSMDGIFFRQQGRGQSGEYLETGEVLTPTIVVAELSEKYRRLGEEFGPRFDFIRSRSRMVQLDDELARLAGETNFQRKKRVKGWGMADSIVLATGRQWRARIVTGDPHFKDLGGEIVQI